MSTLFESHQALLSPPGDTLQETLDAIPMSQAELAERMGRPKEKVNDIIKGREPITTATAFQLEKVLSIPASFWMNREKEYRRQLYEWDQQEQLVQWENWLKEFPVAALKKLGWLPDVKEKHILVIALTSFFGVASPNEWERIYLDQEVAVSFRISLANTQNPHAISAWLRIGELQAKQLAIVKYSRKMFKECLNDIKELAFQHPRNFPQQLQSICARCGVALVYTPNLPKAPISGAVRWFQNNPLIQLTGRYKTDDHFWFTFFHEAGHIIEHGKKDVFLEEIEGSPINEQKEEEANAFAERWLIKDNEIKEIIANAPLSEQKISTFSDRYRVPPGVIVGRLQHKGVISRKVGNRMKQKIELFGL